jgi:hypothetical protein
VMVSYVIYFFIQISKLGRLHLHGRLVEKKTLNSPDLIFPTRPSMYSFSQKHLVPRRIGCLTAPDLTPRHQVLSDTGMKSLQIDLTER